MSCLSVQRLGWLGAGGTIYYPPVGVAQVGRAVLHSEPSCGRGREQHSTDTETGTLTLKSTEAPTGVHASPVSFSFFFFF